MGLRLKTLFTSTLFINNPEEAKCTLVGILSKVCCWHSVVGKLPTIPPKVGIYTCNRLSSSHLWLHQGKPRKGDNPAPSCDGFFSHWSKSPNPQSCAFPSLCIHCEYIPETGWKVEFRKKLLGKRHLDQVIPPATRASQQQKHMTHLKKTWLAAG